MTKETRIGLLVGLLFIIAFAVVLSQLTKEAPTPASTATPSMQAGSPTSPNVDVRAIAYTPVMDSNRRVAPTAAVGGEMSAAATGSPEASASIVRSDATGNVETTMARLPAENVTVSPAPAAQPETITRSGGIETVRLADLAERIGEMPDTAALQTDSTQLAARAPATGKIHEVKTGETPYQIAKAEYGPGNANKYKLILEANRISNASALRVGQKLIIPPLNNTVAADAPTTMPARTRTSVAVAAQKDVVPLAAKVPTTMPASKRIYVVRVGDTLFKIARNAGTSVDKIVKANGVKNSNSLKVGEKLEIPG